MPLEGNTKVGHYLFGSKCSVFTKDAINVHTLPRWALKNWLIRINERRLSALIRSLAKIINENIHWIAGKEAILQQHYRIIYEMNGWNSLELVRLSFVHLSNLPLPVFKYLTVWATRRMNKKNNAMHYKIKSRRINTVMAVGHRCKNLFRF